MPDKVVALAVPAEKALDPKRDRELLDKADELKAVVFSAYVEMAAVLHEIRGRESYKKMGFKTFKEYCEAHLGFKDRKGEYLVSIHKNLVLEAGVKPEELKKIDWSSAREIASLPKEALEKGGGQKWMDKAKNMPVRELADEVREAKGIERDPDATFPVSFVLHEAQYKNVQAALKLAGKITGSDKRNHLLDMICLEFNAARVEESDKKMDFILHQVERVFDVKCVAIKTKGKDEEILFGKKIAKELGVE